jgi:general secretion pathway protein K
MRDLNGCLNLNNLVLTNQPVWRARLDNLLVALELDPSLAGAIVDWLDEDTNVDDEGGAEDSAYLSQPVPYRTGNRTFAHVSELRLVRGVNGDVYARLSPEVCALPIGSSINLNTASIAVLMSLDSRMTAALAARINQDGQARWTDVENALNEASQQNVILAPPARVGLGVDSRYFQARGEVMLDDVPFAFSSVLERVGGGPRGGVHVLQRSRGEDDAARSILDTLQSSP